jgi:hypothetical protein
MPLYIYFDIPIFGHIIFYMLIFRHIKFHIPHFWQKIDFFFLKSPSERATGGSLSEAEPPLTIDILHKEKTPFLGFLP